MDYEQYPWPDDFVEGEVPPNDSIEAAGIAFRLVKGGVPCADDFVGHNKEPFVKKAPCTPSDFGTSMYRELRGIKSLQEVFKPLRKKKIATGTLAPLHGQMSKEADQHTHFETWLRLNTGIELHFKVLEE
ncbi:TPA: hypothetical protein RH039_005051 [Escherichia coli]|uniref:hypothetical protein n=1 Tax=Enterobacteriaceae TaxID=543 RepID=UPI0006510DD5|nr:MULTISPECIES: hypothetical protein [Enterobacteriaceae]EFN4363493.1 hypothetical protein [Escherichia coli]EFN8763234.1 hypothetical protein [Escherichia coli]EHR8572338.1 hypothetical protein [Escherichia coli]EHR8720207.1 hypothetical protein [Escherichia coli]EIM2752484.1 hypothetical protein [Escherichia coli]